MWCLYFLYTEIFNIKTLDFFKNMIIFAAKY